MRISEQGTLTDKRLVCVSNGHRLLILILTVPGHQYTYLLLIENKQRGTTRDSTSRACNSISTVSPRRNKIISRGKADYPRETSQSSLIIHPWKSAKKKNLSQIGSNDP